MSTQRVSLILVLFVMGQAVAHSQELDIHDVQQIEQGNFPVRVHVFEDYETDIEKRWWLRGGVQTKNVPTPLAGVANRRACRSGETLNFDRKMGDRKNKVQGVIFNPVPGPPMAGNTRLSFRYRIEGSDQIKVQIYSLSNGYHRYLMLTGLPQKTWQAATVDMTKARRPDGSGGPLSKDERIDDIQFYVSPETKLVIDDIVLYEPAAKTETRPFPKRIIFTGWFDTGKQGNEWPGDFEIVLHEKPGTWDAARSVINTQTEKPWVRVGLRGRRQLSPKTSVDFRYRLTGKSSLRVSLVDAKTGAQISREIKSVVSGEWTTASLPFPTTKATDRFATDVRFDIESGPELLIDDLLVYEPGDKDAAK